MRAGLRPGVKNVRDAKRAAIQAIRDQAAAGKETVPNDIMNAAVNLAYYGRLSSVDRAVAESYGLTPEIRGQWFKTK